MTEQELRALVREAIARHVGGAAATASVRHQPPGPGPAHVDASHGMFRILDGSQTDGPCIIEPAVMCNHCGYCKSYGH